VRLTEGCVGGYCTGGGKEPRVYIDGKRVSGGPASDRASQRQEIAIVFGGAGDFASVPSTYKGLARHRLRRHRRDSRCHPDGPGEKPLLDVQRVSPGPDPE